MKTFTKTFIAFALAVVYCSGYGASMKFTVNSGGTYIPETPVTKASTVTHSSSKSGYELLADYKSSFNWAGLSKSISKTLNRPQRFRYDFVASTSQTSMLGVNLMNAVGKTWSQDNLRPTLNAYPNPCKDKLKISLEQATEARYRIALQNTIGKVIYDIKVPDSAHNKEYVLDLTNQPAGVYFYSLFVNEKLVETKRLIKQQ